MTIKFSSIPVAVQNIRITSPFGVRDLGEGASMHRSVDIAAPLNSAVLAVSPGVVHAVFTDLNKENNPCGIGVELWHDEEDPEGTLARFGSKPRYATRYCHLAERSVPIKVGDTVRAGQTIGIVGTTGNTDGPHLHFALYKLRFSGIIERYLDPAPYIGDVAKRANILITSQTNTATGTATQTGADISPYITSMDSFHPNIQYELTRRRYSRETVNVHMPYVRLTSLVRVLSENLTDGVQTAYFPTLGIHGQTNGLDDKLGERFDDIYYPKNNRSIVGYAIAEEPNNAKRVPVVVEDASEDQLNIPVPGIVSVTTDRNTAGTMGVRGGLFRATVNLRAYSLGQLNTMLRYFTRPATRVVLELGRTSTSETEQNLSDELSRAIKDGNVPQLFQKFDWKRPKAQIDADLEPIVTLKTGQKDFIQKYIYNNFGDYEIFIGYVVSFKIKYTKENIYEIELLIHSVQQFEVPTKLTGTKPTNQIAVTDQCSSIDIMDYFNPSSAYRGNSFKKMLEAATSKDGALKESWGDHVVELRGPGGSPDGNVKSTGYLVSWKFFVDVVLNDPKYGILSVFQLDENTSKTTMEVLRSGLISPIGNQSTDVNKDLNSNEVSWHKNLRSTDINTMIIHNSSAQTEAANSNLGSIIRALEAELLATGKSGQLVSQSRDIRINYEVYNADGTRQTSTNIKDKLINSSVGSFDNVGDNTSYLTKGVWLNSNAIIDSFNGSDTISLGITRLLNAMNNATQGFWNLQLLSAEPEGKGLHVVDMGLSKGVSTKRLPIVDDIGSILPTQTTDSIQNKFLEGVKKFTDQNGRPQYLYMFNRKSVVGEADDIGGELLDINIDSSLPQVVAVQAIAGVGGVAQRGTLEVIDIEQLKKISLYPVFPDNSVKTSVCQGDNIAPNKTLSDAQIEQVKQILKIEQEGEPIQTGMAERRENVIPVFKSAAEYSNEAINRIIDETVPLYIANYKVQNGSTSEITETTVRQLVNDDILTIRQAVADQSQAKNPGLLALVREYGAYFGRAVDLVEPDITKLIKLLDLDHRETPDRKVHPFNSSNLTKTVVDLTLPGIGGIQLFQAFSVDRVPNILNRGYYVVTKVAHTFAPESGWTTKIQGRFRYDPSDTGEGITQ